MSSHGQSAWIQHLHSDKIKGKYHVNALVLFHEGKEVGRRQEEWASTAHLNDQTRKEVKQYAKQKAEEKKAAMNAIGRDSSEFLERASRELDLHQEADSPIDEIYRILPRMSEKSHQKISSVYQPSLH